MDPNNYPPGQGQYNGQPYGQTGDRPYLPASGNGAQHGYDIPYQPLPPQPISQQTHYGQEQQQPLQSPYGPTMKPVHYEGLPQPQTQPYGQPQQMPQQYPQQSQPYQQYGQTSPAQPAAAYYQPNPYQGYGAYGQTAPVLHGRPARRGLASRLFLPLAILTPIMMTAAGIVGFLVWSQRATPDSVFLASLDSIHSTSSVRQRNVFEGQEVAMIYDVSNITDPKVSTSLKMDIFGTTLEADGYGTRANTFIRFNTLTTLEGESSAFVKKWIQVRNNGVDPTEVDELATQISDPNFLIFGDFVFGNFSAADRQALRDSLKATLAYDAKKVTSETLDGQDVYVYEVTQNTEAVKAYNKKAAEIIGINEAEIRMILQSVESGPDKFKIYIQKNTKRIVKLATEANGIAETAVYSDYNSAELPQQPKPDMQYELFKDQLIGISGL